MIEMVNDMFLSLTTKWQTTSANFVSNSTLWLLITRRATSCDLFFSIKLTSGRTEYFSCTTALTTKAYKRKFGIVPINGTLSGWIKHSSIWNRRCNFAIETIEGRRNIYPTNHPKCISYTNTNQLPYDKHLTGKQSGNTRLHATQKVVGSSPRAHVPRWFCFVFLFFFSICVFSLRESIYVLYKYL